MKLRPAVVCLPGEVGTLKKNIRLPVVAYNEDNISLSFCFHGAEQPEINTAHPVFRNYQSSAFLPPAFHDMIGTFCGSGLRLSLQYDGFHQPAALAAIITHPENIQLV